MRWMNDLARSIGALAVMTMCVTSFSAKASAIVGGFTPADSDTRFDAVCGYIRHSAWHDGVIGHSTTEWNTIGCSGVLVAPNLVLLANHCDQVDCQFWSVRFRRNPDGTVGHVNDSLPHHGAETFFHVDVDCYIPAGSILHPDSGQPFVLDMVLAVLHEPVTHIAPMPIRFAAPQDLPANTPLFVVGWGRKEVAPFTIGGQCPNDENNGDLKATDQVVNDFFSLLLAIRWPPVCNGSPVVPPGALGHAAVGDSGGAILAVSPDCSSRLELVAVTQTAVYGPLLYFAQGISGFPLPPPCPEDLHHDWNVGPADLAQLLSWWGQSCAGPQCQADFNCDGAVGPADLAQLLASWGPCDGEIPTCDCTSSQQQASNQANDSDLFLDWALQATLEELFDWLEEYLEEP